MNLSPGWSWKLAKVRGIEIRLHATFAFLLLWIGFIHYLAARTWQAAGVGVLFILAVFVMVVLHELGHAFMALKFGIRTYDITLLPIGGVARLERLPERPLQEFLVALAGPAVNLAVAGLLFAVLGAVVRPSTLMATELTSPTAFFVRLAWVNLGLACFNLLPAFPMDGGRALRAVLSTRMSYEAATQAAARLGKTLALGFGLLGVFINPILVLIAFFVWTSATAEATATRFKAFVEGVPVAEAMVTEFQALAPEDPLALPLRHSLHGFQHDFPVCQEGRMVGLLTHQGMVEALSRRGEEGRVGEAMEARFDSAAPEELLSDALARFHASGRRILPVLRQGAVVGLLTAENFGEMLLLRSAGAPRQPS